jgi:hypothetical protein
MDPETDEKFAQIESSLSLEQQRLEKLWDAYEQQEKDLNAALDRINFLEADIDTKEITLEKGETTTVTLTLISTTDTWISGNVNYSSTSTFSDIIIKPALNNFALSDQVTTVSVEITASEHALSGTHKVLLGGYTDDIAISKFITVTIV